MHILNQEELNNLCNEWKNILRLNHWDVCVLIARATDFQNDESEGEIEYLLEKSNAIIRILDPIDYPDGPFKQDMEATLVHELLHLHFAPFRPEDEDSLNHSYWERAIDDLSKILVQMKRDKYNTAE